MQNTFWATTGHMDDFGNYILLDMDAIDVAAKSLTTFWGYID